MMDVGDVHTDSEGQRWIKISGDIGDEKFVPYGGESVDGFETDFLHDEVEQTKAAEAWERLQAELKGERDRKYKTTTYPRTELREMADPNAIPLFRQMNAATYPAGMFDPPPDARCEGGPCEGQRKSIASDQRNGARLIVIDDFPDPGGGLVIDYDGFGAPMHRQSTRAEGHIYELVEWIERFDPDDEDTPPAHRAPPWDIKDHYWIWVWKGPA